MQTAVHIIWYCIGKDSESVGSDQPLVMLSGRGLPQQTFNEGNN